MATPFVTGQAGDPATWVTLLCIAAATPIFEEWLFRGYVWRYLRPVFGSGWQLVVVTSVLFGLWHLGYADVIAWEIVQPEALSSAPLWAHLGAKVGVAALMGALAHAAGLLDGYEPCTPRELISLFDWKKIGKDDIPIILPE